MKSDFVAIPLAVFESAEYRSVMPADRDFLHLLYYMFSDCELFRVEDRIFQTYGYAFGKSEYRKLGNLIDTGLIIEANHPRGRAPRVFEFKYPSVSAYIEQQ